MDHRWVRWFSLCGYGSLQTVILSYLTDQIVVVQSYQLQRIRIDAVEGHTERYVCNQIHCNSLVCWFCWSGFRDQCSYHIYIDNVIQGYNRYPLPFTVPKILVRLRVSGRAGLTTINRATGLIQIYVCVSRYTSLNGVVIVRCPHK